MSQNYSYRAHAEEHEGMTKKNVSGMFLLLLGITALSFNSSLFSSSSHFQMTYHAANPIYIVLTLLKLFLLSVISCTLKFEKNRVDICHYSSCFCL